MAQVSNSYCCWYHGNKLEYNRDWTWADMKHWFKNALGGPLAGSTDSAGTSTVYAGVEWLRITQVRCGLMTAPSKVVMRLSFGMLQQVQNQI